MVFVTQISIKYRVNKLIRKRFLLTGKVTGHTYFVEGFLWTAQITLLIERAQSRDDIAKLDELEKLLP